MRASNSNYYKTAPKDYHDATIVMHPTILIPGFPMRPHSRTPSRSSQRARRPLPAARPSPKELPSWSRQAKPCRRPRGLLRLLGRHLSLQNSRGRLSNRNRAIGNGTIVPAFVSAIAIAIASDWRETKVVELLRTVGVDQVASGDVVMTVGRGQAEVRTSSREAVLACKCLEGPVSAK